MPKSKQVIDFALLCHRDDLYLKVDGRLLSPILDSLKFNLLESNVSAVSFLMPELSKKFFFLRGIVHYQTLNTKYFFALFSRKILRFAGVFFRIKSSKDNRVLIKFWIDFILNRDIQKIISIQPPRELCIAANFLKVKIFDLQHGVISRNWYYNERTLERFKFSSRPCAVLCWDEISAKQVNSLWRSTKSIVIGNTWINEFKKNKSNFLNYIKYPFDADSKFYNSIDSPKVLITTQWEPNGFDAIHVPDEIVKLVQSTSLMGFSWLIRFHPLEVNVVGISRLHEFAEKTFGLNIFSSMHDVSNYPLPTVLMNCSYHITSYSATAIEASLMGVRSGLWTDDESRKKYFQEYIQSGVIDVLPNDLGENLAFVLKRLAKVRSNNNYKLGDLEYYSLIAN